MISYEEFRRVELMVGTVVRAEKAAGTAKLIRLEVSFGKERKQSITGIAHLYKPEQLVGKQFVFVTNLRPAKFRGELSECMILAACRDEEEIVLIAPERRVEDGTEVR
jgi:methionine--tRNA ligase beta chain